MDSARCGVIRGWEMKTSLYGYFFQRLKDCFGQNWHKKRETNSRFLECKLLKQSFGLEEYICSMKRNLRDELLKFRAGVSRVKMHKFRFTPGSDSSCPFCPDQKED